MQKDIEKWKVESGEWKVNTPIYEITLLITYYL
jgi:hypothetical protein